MEQGMGDSISGICEMMRGASRCRPEYRKKTRWGVRMNAASGLVFGCRDVGDGKGQRYHCSAPSVFFSSSSKSQRVLT